MNRIILIGNGFDLAQGLKTSYKHFIDNYWDKKSENLISKLNRMVLPGGSIRLSDYKDNDIIVKLTAQNRILQDNMEFGITGFNRFNYLILQFAEFQGVSNLRYKNNFLKQITYKQQLFNWVDIEQEYYSALLQCLDSNGEKSVVTLNKEFLTLQKALEEYLTSQTIIDRNKAEMIYQKIYYPLNNYGKLVGNEDEKYDNLLFLNFNYTNNVKLNLDLFKSSKLINIHGELNSAENAVIFGYGNDLDEKYKTIEQLNNNDYLKNMKLIRYPLARNYQALLNFIETDKYKIFIMGHSCGISDRTLLNMLFEHNNCDSIKPFYHKKEDGTDNFMDLSMNISRAFKDKSLFQERIVNQQDCEPLI